MKKLFFIILQILFIYSVLAQDEFEPNNDPLTAFPVSCNLTYEAFIQTIGDLDWYSFDLNEDGYVSVSLDPESLSTNLNLEIYSFNNGQLKLLADDDDNFSSIGQQLITTSFLNAGNYFILVEDDGQNDSDASNFYTLSIGCFANALEVNQTIEIASPILRDTCFEENIWGENECYFTSNEGDDDQDWFVVEIVESGYLNTTLRSIPSDMNLNLEIYTLENGQAKLIADDDDNFSSGGQDLEATAFVNEGVYYIHIEDDGHNDTNQETFTFCVGFTANELEVNQTIETASPISRDTCFEENIWGENECYFTTNEGDDDQEWFVVEVEESGYLNTTIRSIPSDMNLNLEIFIIENGQAKLIADDDDNFSSGGQDLEATSYVNEGVYYIHIEDDGHDDTNQETFTFCVNFVTNALEVNQTIEMASPISRDTCFEENIWGENECYFTTNEGDDDQEWFVVEVEESGYLNTTIRSIPSDMNLNLEIYTLENGQAKLIADDDDNFSSGGQDLESTAYVNAGVYYIHIEDDGHNDTNQETFTFCVGFTANELEVNQTIETASPISRDTCFEENIWGENECYFTTNEGDDDQDWFVVDIELPCMLNVSLTEVPGDLNLNLEVYQMVNNQISLFVDDGDQNSSGGQSLFVESLVDPGRYYILVKDEGSNSTSGEVFTFCVSCEAELSSSTLFDETIQLFPNPTYGILSVQGLDQITGYQILDLTGKVLLDDQIFNEQLDISFLTSGIYFITFNVDGQFITKKLVKE